MLLNFFTNRWVLTVICAGLVFGEMFLAKKWFTPFTSKISNAKAKRGLNVLFGLVTCFVLSAAQMWALCDVLGAVFYWKFVLAATLGSTLVYLIIEKVFGESEVNALGKAFCEVISHSDMFDGNLTTDGMVSVAKKLLAFTTKLDKKEADKEKEAIDKVTKTLEDLIADGRVTEEEKAHANAVIAESGVNLNGNSTYEKFKALLK